MAIKGEWIDYDGGKGYFAIPEKAAEPVPAIIVIQELFGVNDHIEDITRRFAAAGYAALAPDLFAIDGARPAALSNERIEKSVQFMRKLPPAAWGNPALRGEAVANLPEPDKTEIGETFGKLYGGGPDRKGYTPLSGLPFAISGPSGRRPGSRRLPAWASAWAAGFRLYLPVRSRKYPVPRYSTEPHLRRIKSPPSAVRLSVSTAAMTSGSMPGFPHSRRP